MSDNDHLTNLTDSYKSSGCKDFLWNLAIFLTVLVVISTIGNAVTIYIFSRQKLTPSTFLFMALAVSDFLLLLLSFVTNALPNLVQDSPKYQDINIFITVYGFPVLIITYCMSTWLVVLMAWNRYLAITKPLHYHRITKLKYVCIQVIVLFVICVIFVIPTFFEMEVHRIDPPLEGHHYYNTMTELYKNKNYQLCYKIVSYFILLNLLPLVMLIFFTYKLIKEIRQSNARRQELCGGAQGQNGNPVVDGLRITIVLTTVVVVFILFHTPVLIYRLMELIFFLKDEDWYCQDVDLALYGTSRVFSMCVQINATFNFVIYIISSSSFRRDLKKVCCCRLTCCAKDNSANGGASNTVREPTAATSNGRIIQLIKCAHHNFAFDDDDASNSGTTNKI